jgi:hypothetical protein
LISTETKFICQRCQYHFDTFKNWKLANVVLDQLRNSNLLGEISFGKEFLREYCCPISTSLNPKQKTHYLQFSKWRKFWFCGADSAHKFFRGPICHFPDHRKLTIVGTTKFAPYCKTPPRDESKSRSPI